MFSYCVEEKLNFFIYGLTGLVMYSIPIVSVGIIFQALYIRFDWQFTERKILLLLGCDIVRLGMK